MADAKRRELDALLVAQAIDGLDEPEAARLGTLLAESPGVDAEELERVAAVILLASIEREIEPMPEHVRARLEAAAADASSGDGHTASE